MAGITVRYYPSAPTLRHLIPAYIVTELQAGFEPVDECLPPQWPNVRYALQGEWSTEVAGTIIRNSRSDEPATVIGPLSRHYRLRVQGPAVGWVLGLQPLGWAQLVGSPASEWADRSAPLAQIFGPTAPAAFDAVRQAPTDRQKVELLDAFFLELLARRPEPPALLFRAHAALQDPLVSTAEVFAERLELSPRQATRISNQFFGFPPKLLLRRQRFLRTLATLNEHLDEAWGPLIDPNYCDQSHFVRDFRFFMGSSPSAYYASPRRLLRASAAARQAALGAPMQALHPVRREAA
jgi:AraC-like DNA-binding protein